MSDTRRSHPEVVPADRRDIRALVRMYWPLAALGVAGILVAIVAHHLLFPAYSWNRDEPVYIWQAHALQNGHLRATDGGSPALFRPWLSAAEDGVVFSHFPVGWPLALAASDVIFGSPDGALALACLLAVLGTYAVARELTEDHNLALVAAALMVASPILAIQGGVYLGYIFTLGLGLLFTAALLSGVRRSLPGRLAAAGAVLGFILLTRPYDAFLWGLAAGGYVAYVRRREWRALLRAARWVALGFLPLVVVTLLFNRFATGSLTQFPNTAADPLDKFGFGLRRIMPGFGKFDYGLVQALAGSGRNAFWTPMFLAGSYLGAIVAGFGLWLRRREQSTIAILALGAAFPIGYFFFWGTSISALTARLSGPIYFVPLYAPLCILIATALLFTWKRRRAFGIALLVALIIATIPAALNRFDVNRQLSDVQIPWKRSVKSINGKALVFVSGTGRYLMFLNPYSANKPDLNGRLVYAADRGPLDLDLIGRWPDRTPYLQRASLPPLEMGPQAFPSTPTVTVTRMRVLRGKGMTLSVRITNPKGSPTVGAYIKVGRVVRWRILATNSKAGASYQTEWRVGVADSNGSAATSIIALKRRLGSVTIGVGYGSSSTFARNHPAAKQIFPYRIHASTIEVLLPPVEARARAKNGKKGERIWILVPRLANLKATITSTSGTSLVAD